MSIADKVRIPDLDQLDGRQAHGAPNSTQVMEPGLAMQHLVLRAKHFALEESRLELVPCCVLLVRTYDLATVLI
jgi:hypothetical protein